MNCNHRVKQLKERESDNEKKHQPNQKPHPKYNILTLMLESEERERKIEIGTNN